MRWLAVSLIAMAVVAASVVGTPDARAGDLDCADFPNQAAAQRYYLEQGGPAADPDRLDADDDGIACDTLPCPCAGQGGNPPPRRPKPRKPRRPRPVDFRGEVMSVVDGDTVKVRSIATRRRYTVRLIGIDSPETKPGTPIECGGVEAASNLRELAPRGRRVRVRGDRTQDRTDRDGRLLTYLATPNGRDLGAAQVRAGWSMAYLYERRFARYGQYRRAERGAGRAKRGVWGLCAGNFHTRARERMPLTRDGYRRCDGGTDPDGTPGGFFRDLEIRGDSCETARAVLREWTLAIQADDAPGPNIEGPVAVSGWTCSGDLREGPDNPYFLGTCTRADGAAQMRFFGGP